MLYMEVRVVSSSDVPGLVHTDVKASLPLPISDNPAFFPGRIRSGWVAHLCHYSLSASWHACCKSAQPRGQARGRSQLAGEDAPDKREAGILAARGRCGERRPGVYPCDGGQSAWQDAGTPQRRLPLKLEGCKRAQRWQGGTSRQHGECSRLCVAAQRITSSAWKRRVGGIVRPRAWAVFRLMTSSKWVGCSTGRSAGLVPFRMRST